MNTLAKGTRAEKTKWNKHASGEKNNNKRTINQSAKTYATRLCYNKVCMLAVVQV